MLYSLFCCFPLWWLDLDVKINDHQQYLTFPWFSPLWRNGKQMQPAL